AIGLLAAGGAATVGGGLALRAGARSANASLGGTTAPDTTGTGRWLGRAVVGLGVALVIGGSWQLVGGADDTGVTAGGFDLGADIASAGEPNGATGDVAAGIRSSFVAVRNGDFTDPATWGGVVPVLDDSGDSILVPQGIVVQIQAGGSVRVDDGTTRIEGRLVVLGDLRIELDGTLDNAGSLLIGSNGRVRLQDNGSLTSGGHIENWGRLDLIGGSFEIVGGTVDNVGTMQRWAGVVPKVTAGVVTNRGLIDNAFGPFMVISPGTLINADTGSIELGSGTGSALELHACQGCPVRESVNRGGISGGIVTVSGSRLVNEGSMSDVSIMRQRLGSADGPAGYVENSGTIDGAVFVVSGDLVNGSDGLVESHRIEIRLRSTFENAGRVISSSIVNRGSLLARCGGIVVLEDPTGFEGNPVENACIGISTD
ncbi:MAG: hypothetical protein R3290_13445, partial [Acidimicrobiia bacterium]|nr:hypothetical protein [Acidimicrobiia bacterium]